MSGLPSMCSHHVPTVWPYSDSPSSVEVGPGASSFLPLLRPTHHPPGAPDASGAARGAVTARVTAPSLGTSARRIRSCGKERRGGLYKSW